MLMLVSINISLNIHNINNKSVKDHLEFRMKVDTTIQNFNRYAICTRQYHFRGAPLKFWNYRQQIATTVFNDHCNVPMFADSEIHRRVKATPNCILTVKNIGINRCLNC